MTKMQPVFLKIFFLKQPKETLETAKMSILWSIYGSISDILQQQVFLNFSLQYFGFFQELKNDLRLYLLRLRVGRGGVINSARFCFFPVSKVEEVISLASE